MKLEEQTNELRLQSMMKRWESLKETKQLQGISLKDGLGLLLQAEWESRSNAFNNIYFFLLFIFSTSLSKSLS